MNQDFIEFRDLVASEKYFLADEESWDDVIRRVAYSVGNFLDKEFLSQNEKALQKYRQLFGEISPGDLFYSMMSDGLFLPGGRVLFGAGNPNKVTLTNCYVLPAPEDSIEGILETALETAETFKRGGGVGFDISSLRYEGSSVHNAAKTSTGAWSFSELYSVLTGTIGQSGRRGALLLAMGVTHPDILKFVTSKSILSQANKKLIQQASAYGWSQEQLEVAEKVLVMSQVRFANISVKIVDEFMEAVKEDEMWEFKWKDEVISKQPAREVFKVIVDNAWNWAEPGILFESTAKKYSTTEYFAPIVNTNPCGEQWLEPYGNCNLGAINIGHSSLFVDSSLNVEELRKLIYAAVLFMNTIIWYNLDNHPLEKQKESAQRTRRVGLGIMGLADAYIRAKRLYGDYDLTTKIGKNMAFYAYKASSEMVDIFGVFPEFDPVKHFSQPYFERLRKDDKDFDALFNSIEKTGLANSALLTIAPTGSISIMAGASSGIEPIFGFKVQRWFETAGRTFEFYIPVYAEYMEKGLKPESFPFFQTFDQITPQTRIEAQSILQKYIDNAISSTVNLPQSSTTQDIWDVFYNAWEKGLKGITVYREGSRIPVIKKMEHKKEKTVSIGAPEETYSVHIQPIKKSCMEGKRYRFKPDSETIYLMIFGEGTVPREIFLGSRNIRCYEFAVALNHTLSEILRMLPAELAVKFARRMAKKFREYDSGVNYYILGEKVDSTIGLWGLALDWFIEGVNVEQLEENFKKAMFSLKPQAIPKKEPTGKGEIYINLYGESKIDNLPNDAVLTRCPICGAVHITKMRPYVFDCEHPCQNCGYSNKCNGD